MNDTEFKLKVALQRLETSVQKILDTRGYGKDVKGLKALEELIKEQLTHANTRSAARKVR